MPFFDKYVPDAVQTKQGLEYQFWGRTTLEFNPNCDKSISDAVGALDRMDDAWGHGLEGLNTAILIIASCFCGIQFIWMIISTICFLRMRQHICNKLHAIVYSSFFLAMAIAMFTLVSILKWGGLQSRFLPLLEWSEYSDCVDSYMQINDYQVNRIDEVNNSGLVMWILSLLILLIHFFSVIHSIKTACKGKRCCCCC